MTNSCQEFTTEKLLFSVRNIIKRHDQFFSNSIWCMHANRLLEKEKKSAKVVTNEMFYNFIDMYYEKVSFLKNIQ